MRSLIGGVVLLTVSRALPEKSGKMFSQCDLCVLCLRGSLFLRKNNH